MSRRSASALALLLAFPLAACGDQGEPTLTGVPIVGATTPVTEPEIPIASPIVAGQPIPEDRCQANRDAGPITYLSSFDFSASASIIDVLVADANGYYDELCLDVSVTPSFSTENYPLVAANDAQFSSAGSFSELADFGGRNEVEFVALSVEGRTGIDALLVTDPDVTEFADLKGSTIGVKGKITPSVAAMLAQQGLIEGVDYETVLLEGFDPIAHAAVPGIVGFPGYKSNEPEQLASADVPFTLFDPADYEIPGSFGLIYTNATFLREHRSAVEDFMRATMRGLADAIADPAAAAQIAVDLINANGNALFLSPEGEAARWKVESKLVGDGAADGPPLGVPVIELLQAEVTAYAEIGLFEGIAPDISTIVEPDLLAALYDASGTIIWPAAS